MNKMISYNINFHSFIFQQVVSFLVIALLLLIEYKYLKLTKKELHQQSEKLEEK